jgi:3-deoxy-D-manno-octulosonic-acid transferase
MANFKEVAHKVLAHKAAIQCQDKAAIVQAIQVLYSDIGYRNLLIDNGKAFVHDNRGAVQKLCNMLAEEIRHR